jgi:hypothetical protein
MMRLQDVILKAMAKKITWMAAAEIAGVSDRAMRRIPASAHGLLGAEAEQEEFGGFYGQL